MAEAQTMWLCRCGYLNPGRKPTCGDCGRFRDRVFWTNPSGHKFCREGERINRAIAKLDRGQTTTPDGSDE